MESERFKMDETKAAYNADRGALMEKIELLEQQLKL
jgi:hypothetical protein